MNARNKSWLVLTGVLAIILGTLMAASACSSPQGSQAQNQDTTEVSGTVTEIVSPNISLNTAKGPLVLKIATGTSFLKSDGSTASIMDIRPGMSVKISYETLTRTCRQIQIQ